MTVFHRAMAAGALALLLIAVPLHAAAQEKPGRTAAGSQTSRESGSTATSGRSAPAASQTRPAAPPATHSGEPAESPRTAPAVAPRPGPQPGAQRQRLGVGSSVRPAPAPSETAPAESSPADPLRRLERGAGSGSPGGFGREQPTTSASAPGAGTASTPTAGGANDADAPGVEGSDPSESGQPGAGIDVIGVTGPVDPVEMGGLEQSTAGDARLDECATGQCECVGDGCEGEAGVASVAPSGPATDPQGGWTDPPTGDGDDDGGPGPLDSCRADPDCETADDEQERETEEASGDECDDSDPERPCEQTAGDSGEDGGDTDGSSRQVTDGSAGSDGVAEGSQYSGTSSAEPGHDSQREPAVPQTTRSQGGDGTTGQAWITTEDSTGYIGNMLEGTAAAAEEAGVDPTAEHGFGQRDPSPWATGSAQAPGSVEAAEFIDSDGDGISDNEELNRGTLPDNSDSDGDGLMDSVEVGHRSVDARHHTHTSPTNPDSDGDGISDGMEVGAGTDPNNHEDVPDDDDGDGIPNALEVRPEAAAEDPED